MMSEQPRPALAEAKRRATASLLAVVVIAMMQPVVGAPRPNIVIILSDDMGWSDLGCYGGEIRTPNLDQLAVNGLRFTQFYNTARCCPTRAALLTGLYSHQAGVGHMTGDRGFDAYRGELNDRCLTIAEVLRPAGYATYAVGKWHVARNTKPEGDKHDWPLQRGFDHHYGIISGASHYFEPKHLTRDNVCFEWKTDSDYQPRQYYITDAFTDHAVKYVNEHVRDHRDQPFFLYLAYTAAHWPIHAFAADVEAYNGHYDAGYEAVRQARWARMKQLGLVNPMWTIAPTAGDWESYPDRKWEARMMQAYAAMITRMDAGIGRLVAALAHSGKLDNTLIFFLQDNGGCAEPVAHEKPESRQRQPGAADTYLGYGRSWANVSNTPFRFYKHWEHEGGISTPLIVHWPVGIPVARRNQLVPDVAHLIDLMPSCAAAARASYPKHFNGKKIQPLEGVSLLSVFAGKELKRSRPIFWEHEGNRAVRDGPWKLVSGFSEGNVWELYHMETDRTEMRNLAGEFPNRVSALAQKWDAWAKRVGVQPWPLRSAEKQRPAD